MWYASAIYDDMELDMQCFSPFTLDAGQTARLYYFRYVGF